MPALQPTAPAAAAISVAAQPFLLMLFRWSSSAADRSPRPGPRPETVSVEGGPAPARERAAAETAPRPAPKARSRAATLLDAGFIVLAAVLFIIGIDALIPKMFTAMWPWWVVLIACIRDSSHPGRIQAVLGLCEYCHMGPGLVPDLLHQRYRCLALIALNWGRRSPYSMHSGSSCQCRPLHLGNCLAI